MAVSSLECFFSVLAPTSSFPGSFSLSTEPVWYLLQVILPFIAVLSQRRREREKKNSEKNISVSKLKALLSTCLGSYKSPDKMRLSLSGPVQSSWLLGGRWELKF